MAVYQRGKIWWIDYYFKGRRFREPVSESRQEAINALASIKGDIVKGKFGLNRKAEDRLFEEFAVEFTKHLITARRWWKKDLSRMKLLVRYFGQYFLSELTTYHIDTYKAERRQVVSGACVNRELGLLKCMLNKAIRWGFLKGENPVKGVAYFPETPKERILTAEEEKDLLCGCGESVRPVVILALHTGMRRSELLELKWENVDFRNRFIRVVRSKNNRTRKIPMNSKVYEELRNLRRSGGEYVFTKLRSPERLRCVRSAFERACRKAGIEGLRFHDLRHTFATNLVLSGVDLVTVKELLGHSDISMTVRYSHPSDSRKREAVECLVPASKPRIDKEDAELYSHNLVTIPESDQAERPVSH